MKGPDHKKRMAHLQLKLHAPKWNNWSPKSQTTKLPTKTVPFFFFFNFWRPFLFMHIDEVRFSRGLHAQISPTIFICLFLNSHSTTKSHQSQHQLRVTLTEEKSLINFYFVSSSLLHIEWGFLEDPLSLPYLWKNSHLSILLKAP